MCSSWPGSAETNHLILFTASPLNCLLPSNPISVTKCQSYWDLNLPTVDSIALLRDQLLNTTFLALISTFICNHSVYYAASGQTKNGLTETSTFLCDSPGTGQCSWWVPLLVCSQASCHAVTWKLNTQLATHTRKPAVCWFIIKCYNSGIARWERSIGQDMWQGRAFMPYPGTLLSPQLHVFITLEALQILSFWGFMEA